jgi:hypothetical protein
MNSKRLKQAALFAGLAGFVLSLLTIDPVVRGSKKAVEDDGLAELQSLHYRS